MTALGLTLTAAGRAALVNAGTGGTSAVVVAQVGLTATSFVAAPTLGAVPGEFVRLGTVSGQAVDATTLHLTVRDASDASYTVRGFGLYLADGTLFGSYAQADPIIGKAAVSTLFLAIDLTFVDGVANLIQFGSTNFLDPPASETVAGVARLATVAEALAGLVANKTITPATLASVLTGFVRAERLGVPTGVATLGPDGKLALAQRPPIDLIDVFPAASQAAMLALAATPGDFAVRTDNGQVYVLQQTPATTLGNWIQLSTPSPVSSVNGHVGTVVLDPSDLGAVPTTRQIGAAGLATGGGNLSADRTITVPAASQAETEACAIATKAVTPAGLAGLIARIAAAVAPTRTIGTAGLATGGGSLAADRTITVPAATSAEIAAGTEAGKAVTPAALAGLPSSLTPNGYAMLPGGLLIQWVQVRQLFTNETQFYVTWPIAFAAFVGPVVAMGHSTSPSNVRDLWPQRVGEHSLTGGTIQMQSDDSSDQRLDGFDLIVIGR